MAFYDVALLKQDTDFLNRVAACYAQETPLGEGDNPDVWASQHNWDIASAPGFGDAYASALAQDPPNPNPGSDPGVITDAMILSAVQAIMAGSAPPAADAAQADEPSARRGRDEG
jgi:hypothetical protein